MNMHAGACQKWTQAAPDAYFRTPPWPARPGGHAICRGVRHPPPPPGLPHPFPAPAERNMLAMSSPLPTARRTMPLNPQLMHVLTLVIRWSGMSGDFIPSSATQEPAARLCISLTPEGASRKIGSIPCLSSLTQCEHDRTPMIERQCCVSTALKALLSPFPYAL